MQDEKEIWQIILALSAIHSSLQTATYSSLSTLIILEETNPNCSFKFKKLWIPYRVDKKQKT